MTDNLAALIGSRICHDLISPIGAIGNGVELLTMSAPAGSSPELDLIAESVHNASARIRFFRIAYGAASKDSVIGRQEVISVLTATAQGGRFTYLWKSETDQSRQLVRIAFLLLQCLETALPLGGEIQILNDGDNYILTGKGPRLVVDPVLWEGLVNPESQIDHKASQVQFALLPSVISDAGRELTIDQEAGTITVRF
ncbi:MAG: histidine phosphotransferase ChpT [Gammaproteobacteria bacterium]|jgi:histidine phosphotransferase ChpT